MTNKIVYKYKNYLTKDVINTFLVNSTRLITGPISVVLIPYFLTNEMQGFWYTFISISALSILADLGFTVIITQFAAHEFSLLKFKRGYIEGDEGAYNRISSLFIYITSLGVKITAVAFPIILLIGYKLLMSERVEFDWLYPWIIYTTGSAIKFFTNILLSFYEGCDEISNIQKIRYYNNLIYFVVNIILLSIGAGLYALAITNIMCPIILLTHFYTIYKKSINQLKNENHEAYNWENEILKLMWKYAISWSSGYLIFQLFTPLAFSSFGAVYAGKVGFTITLVTSIFTLSNIWMYAINPKINMLVAQKKWKDLDTIFKRNLKMALLSFMIFSLLFLIVYWWASNYYHRISERMLDIKNILMLLLAWLIQLFINSLASYSRAHKEEPYMISSFIVGIYISITTYLASIYLPNNYLFIGFYTSFIISLPWFTRIFVLRKKVLQI